MILYVGWTHVMVIYYTVQGKAGIIKDVVLRSLDHAGKISRLGLLDYIMYYPLKNEKRYHR